MPQSNTSTENWTNKLNKWIENLSNCSKFQWRFLFKVEGLAYLWFLTAVARPFVSTKKRRRKPASNENWSWTRELEFNSAQNAFRGVAYHQRYLAAGREAMRIASSGDSMGRQNAAGIQGCDSPLNCCKHFAATAAILKQTKATVWRYTVAVMTQKI